ncbi:MAG TPA: copper-binding protein [Erythrobacter sp.]|nr:copper-binding protein [Erythrobacter sp.]
MRWFAIAAFAAFALPANAQDHSAHDTHGNHQPAEEQEEKPADHSTMNHSSMDHSSMDHSTMDHSQHPAALDKSAPNAKAEDEVPARALEGSTHAADEIWGADAMAQSRADLHRSHGAGQLATVRIDRIEARLGGGSDAYLWDLEASYGGDLNKIWLKLEGEGEFGGEVEDAEFQALYSRAITPFFDLQLGARLNVGPETRSHLVVGLQGTAPYWLHVDAAAFLSDRGDLTARAEIEYDQKITQQLILQPRVEAEIAFKDIPEREVGAGLYKIEPGLRLRYEIVPEFASYVGIEYEAKLGETADLARAEGEDPTGFKLLIGLRAWF